MLSFSMPSRRGLPPSMRSSESPDFCRTVPWAKNQRWGIRKAATSITANIELKPPPYPLPLLTIDIWEHAYYLDYKNRRVDYISTFMDKLVSWETVSSRLAVAKAKAAEREKQEERRRQEEDGIAGNEALDTILDIETDEAEAE